MSRETLQILLVEDSQTHALFVQESFKRAKFPAELIIARNLSEARDFLDKSTPDLALIDLFLPDGSGVELLKEQNDPPMFPVVIVTGQGDEQVAVGAMKAGALDYVVKTPGALTEITRVVERVLREWSHIVERRQTEEDLESFSYTVSHDLRNPLMTIIGYTDVLLDYSENNLNEHSRECISAIRNAGLQMATLIDDLLALATVGKVETHTEILDLREIVDEVIEGLTDRIKELGVTVNVGRLPSVSTARTLVRQVFDNLLSNALKYGCREGGSIDIVGARKGKTVRFFVCDHGPGIPEDERSRVFDPFFCGTRGQDKGGSGVGLATVQRIVNRLRNGKIWLEETPGGGCTFFVDFEDEPLNG